MADKVWIAKQMEQAQQEILTPSNPASGNSFSVEINGKQITFIAQGGDVSGVTAGLTSLLQAADAPEYTEITWTDTTSGINATSTIPGKPISLSVFAAGGTAGFSTSGLVPNKSASDLADGVNYSPSGLPATGDVLYFDGSVQTPVKWNLHALSGRQLLAINQAAVMRGDIGLPDIDEDGDYPQFRPTHLGVGATTLNIATGPGPGNQLTNYDLGASGRVINVFRSANSKQPSREAISIKTTNASGQLNQFGGQVGVAVYGGATSVLAAIQIGATNGGQAPSLRLGAGTALSGTISMGNGSISINSPCQTFNQRNGTSFVNGSGAIGTLNIEGGTVNYQGQGAIGPEIKIGPSSTLNLGTAGASISLAGAVKMWANSVFLDRGQRGSYASGFALQNCRLQDVTIDIGPNRTISVVPLS